MSKLLVAFTLVMCGISAYLWNTNDYMTYRDYTVTVVAKYGSTACHKQRCRNQYESVLRTEDGVEFSLEVTLPTYHRIAPGQKTVFKLRPADIRQTKRENIIYFLLPVLSYCVTATLLLYLIGGVIRPILNKRCNVSD